VDTLIAKTAEYGVLKIRISCTEDCWHSSEVGILCGVSRWKIIGPTFFTETVTTELKLEFIMKVIPFWKLTNNSADFNKMGLRRIQKIQQCKCWPNSLAVALFFETCGPPRALHISPQDFYRIFEGFWRRTCTKTTRTHERDWMKILSCAFRQPLQKLFCGLHHTRGIE
jgi:hypothetical protein